MITEQLKKTYYNILIKPETLAKWVLGVGSSGWAAELRDPCPELPGLVPGFARGLGSPSSSWLRADTQGTAVPQCLEPAAAAGGGHWDPVPVCSQEWHLWHQPAADGLCLCPVGLQGCEAADPGARALVHDRQVPDADEGALHRRPLRLRHRLQVPALRGGTRARELHQQGECSLGSWSFKSPLNWAGSCCCLCSGSLESRGDRAASPQECSLG